MKYIIPFLIVLPFALTSCGGDAADDGSSGGGASGIDAVWASSAPADAQPVLAVKAAAQTGDEVVVIGRVKDFNSSLAAFTLIDSSLKSCKETKDDMCKTPWDYCCVEPNIVSGATISIEVHDDAGRPHKQPMKGFHGLDHLQTIRVKGIATRDDAGNLRIAASAIHRE